MRKFACAGLVLIVGGCTESRDHGATNAGPPPVPSVEIVMKEFSFIHSEAVPAGRVIFRVSNGGEMDHQVTVLRIPEDLPGTIHDYARMQGRAFVPVFALRDRTPGDTSHFALDLEAGRYGLVCIVRDPAGVAHSLKGMASEFIAGDEKREPPARGRQPAATTTSVGT